MCVKRLADNMFGRFLCVLLQMKLQHCMVLTGKKSQHLLKRIWHIRFFTHAVNLSLNETQIADRAFDVTSLRCGVWYVFFGTHAVALDQPLTLTLKLYNKNENFSLMQMHIT